MSSPNKKPMKGFIKELAKPAAKAESKEKFDWKKPVASKKDSSMSMHTPQRMARFRESRPIDTSLVDEHNKFVKKRRGED